MEGSIEKYDCIICIQIIKDMNDESAISLQVHECVTEDFLRNRHAVCTKSKLLHPFYLD